jgi:DNA-binding NtrC family response regulator
MVAQPVRSVLVGAASAESGRALQTLLAKKGFSVHLVTEAAQLEARIAHADDELVLAELSLLGEVEAFFQRINAVASDLTIVVLVGDGEIQAGVDAVRAGAADFLRLPVESEELDYVVKKAAATSDFLADAPPRSVMLVPQTQMIGTSPVMQQLLDTLRRAADGVATVLIRGESGSGKEVVARLVHELSPRARGPHIKVHTAALPDNLLESELFGYERGAFTGATAKKPGRVELAEGGTLFLDEIGDVSPAFQVKLLRLLQDKEYEVLGGTRTVRANVRFVAATHQNLEALVQAGKFREDLFYRLNVVSLWVPPLRARPEDIEPLALHFCASVATQNGRGSVVLDFDALEMIRKQPWPGNVRQLQNFIERLVVLARGPRISGADVQRELGRQQGPLGFAEASGLTPEVSLESTVMDLERARKEAETRAIKKALSKSGGNKNLAARLLGISRRSLYYKLSELGLE